MLFFIDLQLIGFCRTRFPGQQNFGCCNNSRAMVWVVAMFELPVVGYAASSTSKHVLYHVVVLIRMRAFDVTAKSSFDCRH